MWLSRARDISAFHAALPKSGLGEHKDLEGDSTRTADLNWPKGYSRYSILHDIMHGGGGEGDWLVGQPLLRMCLASVGRW